MLAAFQRALATLYVDHAARERFAADPPAYAASFGLDDVETARLQAIGERRLHAYVDALDRKRANEAARMLPLGARLLGPAFRRAFFAYARRRRLGAGEGRYRDDALGFVDDVAKRGSADLGALAHDVLDYEAQWLRMWTPGPTLRWRTFRRPIERIARAVATGAPVPDEVEETLVFWLRRGDGISTVSRPIPPGLPVSALVDRLTRRFG